MLRNIQGHYSQAKVQKAYMQCHEPFDVEKSLFFQEATKWRKPYLNFLLHTLSPPNHSNAIKIKIKSPRFFVEEGQLFQRSFKRPLRGLAGDEMTRVLREIYAGACGEH